MNALVVLLLAVAFFPHSHSFRSSHSIRNDRFPSLKMSETNGDKPEYITIVGFGSLLSERSSRMTFPDLQNFRLGRVPNYRRAFSHPASNFFQRGISNMKKLEMSSLSLLRFYHL